MDRKTIEDEKIARKRGLKQERNLFEIYDDKAKSLKNVSRIQNRFVFLDLKDGDWILWPYEKEGKQRQPLTNFKDLHEFKNLVQPTLKAVVNCSYKKSSYRTLLSTFEALSQGFFCYLKSKNAMDFRYEDIDQSVITGFEKFLNQANENGSAKWAQTTRAKRFKMFWRLLEGLPNSVVDRNGLREPRGWPKRHLTAKSFQGLEIGIAGKVYRAAVRECERIMGSHHEAITLLEQHREEVRDRLTYPKNYQGSGGLNKFYDGSLGRKLAAIEFHFPDKNLPRNKIALDHACGTALYKSHRNFISDLYPRIVPTPDAVIPFVILLGFWFTTNTGPLAGMQISEFEEFEVMETRRIRWRENKPRSSYTEMKSFVEDDAADNPKVLLDFLKLYTSTIRHLVDHVDAQKVFIFCNNRVRDDYDGNRFRGFVLADDTVSLKGPIGSFCKRNELPYFNLSELRQTTLDIVDVLWPGDIIARKSRAGHVSAEITDDHYTDSIILARNHERLGIGIAHMHRSAQSKGNIDARQTSPDDSSAATPGFSCADPFDSPFAGQKKGSLCMAYGYCPICPLAGVNVKSPRSAAILAALRIKIDNAKGRLPAARFDGVWREVIEKLDQVWLPKFSEDVLSKAEHVKIPELAAVE